MDFWNLSWIKDPLMGKTIKKIWTRKPYPVRNDREIVNPERIVPDDIDIEKLLGLKSKPVELLTGDFINPLGCVYPEAWMEALIGCPIYVSAYGCVSKPVKAGIREMNNQFNVDKALQSDWLEIMDEVLLRAMEFSDSKIPVRQLHLRGIIDMLAAYLGAERLCMMTYDHPEKLEMLADRFTDLYITIVKRGLEIRKPWRGGYVSTWGVYAPESLVDYQIDASSLFSSPLYEKHFLKYDRKVLKKFPYSVVHLHACGLYLLNAIFKIKELKAIEISLDRETGIWEKDKVLAYCKKIQDNSKCIIINGELSESELLEFKSVLSPNGLAIYYWNS